MNAWKWSVGDSYLKSTRPDKIKPTTKSVNEYDTQTNAITQSLEIGTFFNQNLENKRENIDIKMADREMLSQRGVNPFMQTSYVNDVVTRDIFMKPINTTQGKNKEINKGEQ